MKTYKVTIKGQQLHIKGDVYENQDEDQVEALIYFYWDEDHCPKPKMNGDWFELNNDKDICIEEEL